MRNATVRTTIALPADLLAAADHAVAAGQARSRNELVANALRHELAAYKRAAIDAAFADLGSDADHRAEVAQLEAEFGAAGWEAFRQAERS